MSDTTNATERLLREIQRDLADMRDDRTVMIAMLNRHDSSITNLAVELRAMRSQFDRFRNEVHEGFAQTGEQLGKLHQVLQEMRDPLAGAQR